MKKINLPPIPENERTPVITMLLKVIEQQQEALLKLESEVIRLKDEVKRLKKHPKRPKLKPSNMNNDNGSGRDRNSNGKRAGSSKRKKTDELLIHKTQRIKADNVPLDAVFKGYDRTRYELERWRLPTGEYVVAKLPDHLRSHHYGPMLRSYILYQYHHLQVTQPLLLDQLREWGIDISKGQLNHLLIDDKVIFHDEKDELLRAGLSVSAYVNVDDTGARHQGKNGYCTHIGNELFAWFASTETKSRINFLELLRADKNDYHINESALHYMREQRLPKGPRGLLLKQRCAFKDKETWEQHLNALGISNLRHRRIATEGALIGGLLLHGFNPTLVIVSDDAGQFNVFLHAICWIHAERKIHELIPLNNNQAAAIEGVRRFFWQFYDDLKAYKALPTLEKKKIISKNFDALFSMKTCYETLNQVLKRLKRNKLELLLALDRPDVPLHNNLSENDIREYVKRRKVSGGTRSDEGRRCRDTFASLKKTCKKLKIRFWDYIQDRILGINKIPRLPDLIREAATA